jgi:acyl-CoA thioesterase FadM
MNLPDPSFAKEFPVRYYELDSHGNVSPVTLLNYLQDTAGLHAAQLGVAVSDLCRLGLTWVLSRVHLVIAQYPRAEVLYGETVLSRCFAGQDDRCLHQIINRESGRELARLRTRFTMKRGKS